MSAGGKHPILGNVVIASQVITEQMDPRRVSRIIMLLSGCVALMMTGYGLVMPVFARRLSEFGDGVEELGLMTMSFALAQMIGAPIMGSLADSKGRRPIILLAMTTVTLQYIGYLLAPSTLMFILIRGAAGFLSAGLFPASMGVVADLVAEDRRARWAGIIMGSYAVGMIFGPVIGGLLYDGFGYSAPFILSAVVAFLALIAAIIMIPETRSAEIRNREMLRSRYARPQNAGKVSIWEALPRPVYIFGTLLMIDFISSFSFAFVEPQMIFYFYDVLNWSTTQFGILVGIYGLFSVAGQIGLGQLSDKWGRKPLILAGLVPNMLFFAGLAVLTDYYLMMIGAAFAGLGNALIAPAANAFYLDITAEEYRSRIIGVKGSFLSLGGVMGPLAVAAVAGIMAPQHVFWIASGLVFIALVLGISFLREPQHTKTRSPGIQEQVSNQRSLAAQASLRNIVVMASAARAEKYNG
jgi:DHA1 family tetracycline resistance protein-like MFS transporter